MSDCKLSNTLRQKQVHPKGQTPTHEKSNVVYAIQCQEECRDLYIRETKQLLCKQMPQHRQATYSGPNSAVHLHVRETERFVEDNQVRVEKCNSHDHGGCLGVIPHTGDCISTQQYIELVKIHKTTELLSPECWIYSQEQQDCVTLPSQPSN